MVEKKIKKFFNSVPVQERMFAWPDDGKQNGVPFAWIALGLLVGIGILIGVGILMKEDFSASEAD